VKKFVSVLLLGLLLFLAACSTSSPTETPSEPVLELIKDDTVIALTMEELKALPSVEGLGGIMSSTGKITPPEKYKGVLVTTLLEQLGGLSEDRSVEVIAEDGYSITFSTAQIIEGNYITYDRDYR